MIFNKIYICVFGMYFNYKAQVKAGPKADIKGEGEGESKAKLCKQYDNYLSVKEEEKEMPKDVT